MGLLSEGGSDEFFDGGDLHLSLCGGELIVNGLEGWPKRVSEVSNTALHFTKDMNKNYNQSPNRKKQICLKIKKNKNTEKGSPIEEVFGSPRRLMNKIG